ncbi:MAG: hypothetical protein SAK29_20470 [Scytonema sp. PMC 1069.18]|nr:hypothetical protein [Scytonema sp. PMC 1069.18]MEC4880361.1 hypothetical protein [Scytonema sp. PMC 1070.18]
MIEGRFGENGQIYFEIDLIGKDGISFPAEAMLDTGFTEFLAMNKQDVQSLDWSKFNCCHSCWDIVCHRDIISAFIKI